VLSGGIIGQLRTLMPRPNYIEMMITWLALAAFAGTISTLAYATSIYAFAPIGLRMAALAGIVATLVTFIGLSSLLLSEARQIDAGGMFVHFLFIVVASIVGGPIGSVLFRAAVEKIEQRVSVEIDD
jgi:hypothetical protein